MLGVIFAGILSQLMEADLKERIRRFLLIFVVGVGVYVGLSLLAMVMEGESLLPAIPFISTIVAFLPLGVWLLRSS